LRIISVRDVNVPRCPGGRLSFGSPVALEVPDRAGGQSANYDISPDGGRVYFLMGAEAPVLLREFNVVVGWRAIAR
jgi:hypothetical protein